MTIILSDGSVYEVDYTGVSPITGELQIGIHRAAFADLLPVFMNKAKTSRIVLNDGKKDIGVFEGYIELTGIIQDVTGSLQITLRQEAA